MRLVERRRRKKLGSDLMTPQEFADRLGITRLRVYKWLERGHIAAYQIGPDKHPLYLIPKSELAVGRSRL